MNLQNMDIADFQMLAALTNAAAAAQQQQQAAQAFASISAQQQQQQQTASAAQVQQLYSRQSTPPISGTNTPKASTTNNTRTPTPTQNGIPQVTTSSSSAVSLDHQSQSKYQQLLSVIEEMSKDIRPTYAGSKSSAERLKRGIVYARILVRECLVETERSARN
jgi:hypothetical protein